ncbi:MAG: hypothetical protein ACI4KB_12155 [Oscillospiraceae bacterium]
MSTREMVYNIINEFSETQLVQVPSMLRKKPIDDAEDVEICERMLNDYLNDDDPDKRETISLDDFATEFGISLNELI